MSTQPLGPNHTVERYPLLSRSPSPAPSTCGSCLPPFLRTIIKAIKASNDAYYACERKNLEQARKQPDHLQRFQKYVFSSVSSEFKITVERISGGRGAASRLTTTQFIATLRESSDGANIVFQPTEPNDMLLLTITPNSNNSHWDLQLGSELFSTKPFQMDSTQQDRFTGYNRNIQRISNAYIGSVTITRLN